MHLEDVVIDQEGLSPLSSSSVSLDGARMAFLQGQAYKSGANLGSGPLPVQARNLS